MPCKDWYFRTWGTEDSDIHGLKHITRHQGGKLRKTVWLCFFLTAAGYCLYQIQFAFTSYFSYYHVTKVDVEYVPGVEFPAITMCNFNKYRQSAFTENDIRNVGVYLGIINEEHELLNPHLYTTEFQEFIANVDWSKTEIDENFNMSEFQLRTGHQLKDMIIECDWKENTCPQEDFIHRFTHFGNCFTFNDWAHGNARHNSSTAGASNGLRLIIDIEEREYTPTNDLDASGLDAGIKVMLHHPTEPPYIKELGFSIAPGFHTFVSMKHEQISSLGAPYTSCHIDGSIRYFSHYSLQACRIECETDVIVEECGCRLLEQPGNATVCNPEKTHVCAHPLLVEVIEGTSGHDDCACRNPCEVMRYPIVPTIARLRPTFIEKMFRNTEHNMTEEYIGNNIAVLSVYYEALNYETIEQRPEMNVLSLLALIGGNLGLFLGASLLSFVQIAEYCLDETLLCLGCLKKDKMMRQLSGHYNTEQMTVIENGNADKNIDVAAISSATAATPHSKNGFQ